MDIIEIQYHFKTADGLNEIFNLRMDGERLDLLAKPDENLPPWTELGFHQCPHCPLDPGHHPNCPVASCLVDVVTRFERIASFDQIDVEVVMGTRRVKQNTTAQRGISSLIGLLFPVCGCPHTAFFKPMARFHLPMSSEEDTIFRATGMYLIAQLFIRQAGGDCDIELAGLKKIYRNLHVLNTHITERIRYASRTDSSVNALVFLDLFTSSVPFVIEDQLEDIRHLFTPYLADFYAKLMKE